MIIRRSDIYGILRATLKGNYSIGLHGISSFGPRWGDGIQASDEEIARTADEIMSEGMVIFNNRTINGTVEFFGRIDDADNVQHINEDGIMNYNYGGREICIVAIPTIIKSKSGSSMYLGDTQIYGEYRRFQESRGYQISTLRDEVMSEKVISPKYILGSYSLLGDGMVDFKFNPKHMCFNNHVISDEEYEMMEEKIRTYLTVSICWHLADIVDANNIINYDKISNEERIKLYECLRAKLLNGDIPIVTQEAVAALLETLKQYINEPKMRKLDNVEDIDAFVLLSQLSEKCMIEQINQDTILSADEINLSDICGEDR